MIGKMKSRGSSQVFRIPRLLVLLIIIFSVVMRIIFVAQISESDISGLLTLDSSFYWNLAEDMLSGAPFSRGPLTFNPFYPLLLFMVFKAFGAGFIAVRVLQAAIGVLNLFLIYSIATKLFGRIKEWSVNPEIGALVALFSAVFYQNLVFYEGMLLATTFVVFFLLIVLYLSIYAEDILKDRMKKKEKFLSRKLVLALIVSGLITGIGATARPNFFLLLLVVLPVWYAFRFRRIALRIVTLYLIPAILFLAIPIGYNLSKGAGFVPVTAHGGINLYIGNGPSANGLFKPPEGMRTDMRGLIEDAKTFSERELGRPLTHAQSSAYWTKKAVGYITSHPWRWVRLLFKKLYLFFNGTEVPDVIDRSMYIESCSVLRLCFFPYSVISALAIAGIVLMALKWRENGIFLLFLGAGIASVVIFYINTRYRLPSVPLMAISGSYFVLWFLEQLKRRSYAKALAFFCVSLLSFFLISTTKPIEVDRSALYTFLGNFYMQKKEEEKAFRAFRTAYELDPKALETEINYARLLNRKGRLTEAKELYSQAFSKRPDFPNLAIEYGALLEKMGDTEEARKLYVYAYRSGSKREKVFACKLLSRLSYSSGNRDGAIEWIKRALQIVPRDAELIKLLNRLEEK